MWKLAAVAVALVGALGMSGAAWREARLNAARIDDLERTTFAMIRHDEGRDDASVRDYQRLARRIEVVRDALSARGIKVNFAE